VGSYFTRSARNFPAPPSRADNGAVFRCVVGTQGWSAIDLRLSIAQKSDGFLWLGTDDGLVSFDGLQFTQWRPALPKGELPGQVHMLHVSPHGELLFGTGTGLVGIMRKDGVDATQLDAAVDSIQVATDGSVWVATNAALWHLDAATLEPAEPPIQLPDGASGPLQGDGREWIATQTGLFNVEAGRMVQVASGRTWPVSFGRSSRIGNTISGSPLKRASTAFGAIRFWC
jgi:ligand-binding sensor domain-containing protein